MDFGIGEAEKAFDFSSNHLFVLFCFSFLFFIETITS